MVVTTRDERNTSEINQRTSNEHILEHEEKTKEASHAPSSGQETSQENVDQTLPNGAEHLIKEET